MRKQPTISHFSHVFPAHQRTLLIGPSGAGKSSLILALNGLIPQSIDATVSGRIKVGEINPLNEQPGSMSQKVGILFQDPETQFCMVTLEEEVAFGLENLSYSKEEMDRKIIECLNAVGLLERRKDPIHSLSGGMKQKLAFACLMAIDPDILVLDEPTANLDPKTSQDLIKQLDEWSSTTKKTVIVIEHQVEDVLPIIDSVVAMDKNGNILAKGSPREVFKHHGLRLMEEGIFLPYASTLALQSSTNWQLFPLTSDELKDQLIGSTLPSLTPSPQVEGTDMLTVENLTFRYPNQEQLFEKLSFSVKEGSITAIVGENGAGKTTLAQLLVRALQPLEGKITLKSKDLADYSEAELMKEISLVLQRPETQFIAETVEAEMAFGPTLLGLKNWEKETDSLLDDFGLLQLKKAHPYTLSQGQKRRLSVAIMLANGQKFLVLDEPTFGQDALNTQALMDQLERKRKEGYTFLMITHDMNLVERYASQVIVLDKGKCLYQGDPTTLFHTEKNQSIVDQANLITPEQVQLEQLMKESRGRKHA
jgi:energy-coupling factor transport system ATP-binding protein